MKFFIVCVLGVALLFSLVATLEKSECIGRWEESNYAVKWKFFGGCLVNKDGVWVPASAVREVP